MYKLYRLTNTGSGRSYIGMTQCTLNRRMEGHRYKARKGYKTPLYDAIRSYGWDKFEVSLIKEFNTRQDCCEAETALIAAEDNLYNLAAGGDGGFNIVNIEDWKQKLKSARKGGRPFLGHSHSEETKQKCREASRRRWARQRDESNELV